MMNYLWSLMIIIGFIFALIVGKLEAFGSQMLSGAQEAVTFILGLAGIMAMWSGLMKIAEESGLIEVFARWLRPLTRFLFQKPISRETEGLVIISFIANLFGAGNSSTVFALRTMERLDLENNHSSRASNEMCMFMVVNMSMIQLVPVTVIQIRSQLGSHSPSDIILPSIIAGVVILMISVLLCKLFERIFHGNHN